MLELLGYKLRAGSDQTMFDKHESSIEYIDDYAISVAVLLRHGKEYVEHIVRADKLISIIRNISVVIP